MLGRSRMPLVPIVKIDAISSVLVLSSKAPSIPRIRNPTILLLEARLDATAHLDLRLRG
jgi:hypothetical protein